MWATCLLHVAVSAIDIWTCTLAAINSHEVGQTWIVCSQAFLHVKDAHEVNIYAFIVISSYGVQGTYHTDSRVVHSTHNLFYRPHDFIAAIHPDAGERTCMPPGL